MFFVLFCFLCPRRNINFVSVLNTLLCSRKVFMDVEVSGQESAKILFFLHLIDEYVRLHNHHLGLIPFQCEWSQWASISLACQIRKCFLWRAKIINTNHHAHSLPCGHYEYRRWVGWFEKGQSFSNALAFAVMVLWIIIHTAQNTSLENDSVV